MRDYNIRLKRYNGVDYDNLYPETKTNLLIGNIAKSQLESGSTYTAVVVTLDSANWGTETLEQTVTVQGVTATNAIIVAPSVNSMSIYADSGIYCIAQAQNSLTFKCESIPESDVNANILILT